MKRFQRLMTKAQKRAAAKAKERKLAAARKAA
jgi:hypothetical protein